MRSKLPIRADFVSFLADFFRDIQNDCHWQDVELPRKGYDFGSGFTLNVRGIDHRQFTGSQSFAGDVIKHVEGVESCFHAVFIVADPPPARVGRQDFGRQEVFSRKGAFAGTAGSNKRDESKFWDFDIQVCLCGDCPIPMVSGRKR